MDGGEMETDWIGVLLRLVVLAIPTVAFLYCLEMWRRRRNGTGD